MSSVPDTTTFCLSDVTSIIGVSSLCAAHQYANYDWYDPSYRGDQTCLLNFRNYTEVTYKNVEWCVYDCYCSYNYKYLCACLVVSPSMSYDECFNIYLYGDTSVDYNDGNGACAEAYSGDYNMYLCSSTYNNYFSCEQCWTIYSSTNFTAGLRVYTDYGYSSVAQIYISNLVSTVGCFQSGGCNNILLMT